MQTRQARKNLETASALPDFSPPEWLRKLNAARDDDDDDFPMPKDSVVEVEPYLTRRRCCNLCTVLKCRLARLLAIFISCT